MEMQYPDFCLRKNGLARGRTWPRSCAIFYFTCRGDLGKQAVNDDLARCPNKYLAVNHRGLGELNDVSHGITRAGLIGVVQFFAEIAGIIGAHNSGTALHPLQHPDNAVLISIG